MARARNIKPALFKNEILGVEDPLLTLLFINLWCLADREGKLEDRPLRIKAETFPYRENIDINGYLTKLVQHGFIRRYSVNGVAVIQVIKFGEHQSPHNTEKASTLPDYDPNHIDNNQQNDLTVKSPLDFRESTKAKRPDSLIPDSLNTDSLIPDSGMLNPSLKTVPAGVDKTDLPPTKNSSEGEKAPIPKKPKEVKRTPEADSCSKTWGSYSEAYFNRYGAEPVRNATVNAQIVQFVRRIGHDESPHVAAFFVHHNNQFYVQKMHTVGLLLAEAEKIRTEWATKRQVTNTQARQADKKQSNVNVFNHLLDEQKEVRSATN